jgi:hypothetical protein
MNDYKEKKTRFSLNIEQKYAIIKYRDEHPNKKQKDLIEYFNKLFKCRIPPTTMSGILAAPSRDKILKLDDIEVPKKRVRESKYPDMERMVFVWYAHVITKGLTISDDTIIQKAKEFGSMLGIEEGTHFSYSQGWLEKFKIRYKIKQYQIHGESGSVSEEFVDLARNETREFIKSWLAKGNGRSLRDVFNLDETALFYKLLPTKT